VEKLVEKLSKIAIQEETLGANGSVETTDSHTTHMESKCKTKRWATLASYSKAVAMQGHKRGRI
jgi:hypothetical protein